MEIRELKDKYDDLIEDIDFDELELCLRKPNIFDILSISSHEMRHSNFLSWLLNPKGNHGLENIFLIRFLREIFKSELNINVDQIEVSELDYSSVEIRREWNNIDLLILFDEIVVSIENKIYSGEHSNQLKRYKKIVNTEFPSHRKVFVYLTPQGNEPSDKKNYIPISYQSIINYLNRILDVYSESINKSVLTYIQDYITTLKRELMESDKSIELSHRIYRNHKEILDFIFEHKPDYIDRVRELLKDVVSQSGYILGSENKYYVRFTTPQIEPLTYYNEKKDSWRNGESFLFELILDKNQNKVIFKPVVSPSLDGYDSNRLSEILQEIENFSKPTGNKWLVPYHKKFSFRFDKVYEMNDEEIEERMEKIVSEIEETVEIVESKFLEYEDELFKLKNFRV